MTVLLARDKMLSEDDYIAVLRETTLGRKRPLANRDRIRSMLDGANFIVTARDEAGSILGLARCITDGNWVCYCAELAVRDSYQGLGIGKALLGKCSELLGPGISLVLVAEPEAVGFYERIGMEHVAAAFVHSRTDRS